MSRDARIPQPLLELAARAEKDSPTAASLAARVGLDEAAVFEQLEGLRNSDQEILRAYPPAEVAAEIRARLRCQPAISRASVRKGPLLAIGAAAAVALGAVWLVPRADIAVQEQAVRAKGDARLLLFRRDGAAPERLHDGSVARAGDVLQLGYVPAESRHGVLLSIDGAGEVTLHSPSAPSQTSALKGRKTMLPFSFRLDHAPGFERFVLITSDAPLDVRDLLRRARALANGVPRSALSLPVGVESDEIVLNKPSRGAR